MKFTYSHFSCDATVYKNESDLIVKFHDSSQEQTKEQFHDLVVVDPGHGYISLKMIGKQEGLISGFLDEAIFKNDEMIEGAIDFVKELYDPILIHVSLPYHICKIKTNNYIEYNGEY